MPLIRHIVLLLLVISLPTYGWAFAAMPMCSMQSAQQATLSTTAATSSMTTAPASHCCGEQRNKHTNKADQFDRGCQGSGAQCQCGAPYQALQPLTALVISATHIAIPAIPFPVITTTAVSLWRPPTLS